MLFDFSFRVRPELAAHIKETPKDLGLPQAVDFRSFRTMEIMTPNDT
jgi:hypothetical protein